MQYIQIDNFNGCINIITKDDDSGEPLVFNSLKEAQDTLEENCQNGQIIPLGIDVIDLIANLADFRSSILIEEGEDNFEDEDELDELIDNVLDNKN